MGNYTATSDMSLETAITNGSMVDGENLTITTGAVVTCTEKPSILIGDLIVSDGRFFVDGLNIASGNSINFIGEGGNSAYDQLLDVRGQGTFEVKGDWFSLGTTDGTDSQSIDLSSATGFDYWDGDNHIGWIPMIQIETGRRVDFDGATGITPSVGDWIYLTSDRSVMGKVHSVGATWLVLWYLTGAFVDNSAIECRSIVDNEGPDLQTSWTASVNNVSGDIKETGVYQEFGNSRSTGVSYISGFHHGIGGFVFDHAWQATSLTLGSAAGTVGGFVAPSGCAIRIPNVMFGSAGTVDYALNNLTDVASTNETYWWQLDAAEGGSLDLSICNFGNVLMAGGQAFAFVAEFVGATLALGSNVAGTKTTFDHCVIIQDPLNASLASIKAAFFVQDNLNGTTITFCMCIMPRVNGSPIGCESSVGVIISDCIMTCAGQGSQLTGSGSELYRFFLSDNITFDNNVAIGSNHASMSSLLLLSTITNFHCKMFLYSATQNEVQQTQEKNVITVQVGSKQGSFHGIEQIGAGNPGNNLMDFTDSSFFKVRGFGMIDDKISLGTDGEYAVSLTGSCTDLDFARMWKTDGITEEFIFTRTTSKNIVVQNCSGKYASLIVPRGAGGIRFKGLHGASGTPGGSSGWEDVLLASYGFSFHDTFESDTAGVIGCLMVTPSAESDETTITAGNPKFFKDGDLDMVSSDVIEFEMGYFAKGHTGFTGVFSAITGSGSFGADEWSNVTLDFQWMLDGGAWNGSWLNVRTAGNWTGIAGAIEAGVKLKFRFTATGTQSSMSMLIIGTTTTLADQTANLYPIDQNETTATITVLDDVTGLAIEGAHVVLVDTDDYTTEIINGSTDSNGIVSSTFVYVADVPVEGWVRQMDLVGIDYTPKNISGVITSSGLVVTVRLSPI